MAVEHTFFDDPMLPLNKEAAKALDAIEHTVAFLCSLSTRPNDIPDIEALALGRAYDRLAYAIEIQQESDASIPADLCEGCDVTDEKACEICTVYLFVDKTTSV